MTSEEQSLNFTHLVRYYLINRTFSY